MVGQRYVAALGWRALNRLYDPGFQLTMPERRLRGMVLDQANVRHGDAVLDVGAGTGSLVILMARRGSRARLVGVDGDLGMVRLARNKAIGADVKCAWITGMATELPIQSATFDKVLTTFVLHHLTTDNKRDALAEMCRVLRPGGELHIADWGKPHTRLMRVAALALKTFEPADGTAANLQGRLGELCEHAGFADVRLTVNVSTIFGTVAMLRAIRPLEIERPESE